MTRINISCSNLTKMTRNLPNIYCYGNLDYFKNLTEPQRYTHDSKYSSANRKATYP